MLSWRLRDAPCSLHRLHPMTDTQTTSVVHFYDTHPINEEEILTKLVACGVDVDEMTEEALKEFDQDHFGGTEAVDVLAERAGIKAHHQVLDVCSGMGGPARLLAHRIGCRVTGIDLTQSRVESARRLTERVGLSHLVDFVHGDATAMPLPDAAYDVLVSQEAWAHVPDRSNLIAECARVLKPGGVIAFTSIVTREGLTSGEQARLAAEMASPEVPSPQDFTDLLLQNGCPVRITDDLSAEWTEILIDRLEMYRSLRDTTVAKFGEEHFRAWDATYSFFVDLYRQGKLGGVRIVATKDGAS